MLDDPNNRENGNTDAKPLRPARNHCRETTMNDSVPIAWCMPAEWEPHERCWMAWPCNAALWGADLVAGRRNFADVVREIANFEPVTLLVRAEDRKEAHDLCGSGVEYWEYPLDDSWMRDFGPTFVRSGDGAVAGVDWRFNGWGKYPHQSDRHVASFVLGRLGLPRVAAPLVLEGGAIHVDGEGAVLTTAQCLLHPNRNPALSQPEIERLVLDHLGAERMIWLERGLADDDTDGHIDEIACFVAPARVLALIGSDPHDVDYPVLQANLEQLRRSRDAQGRALEVVTVEQPAVVGRAGKRLSQSYVNFYIANGGVVMPAFGDRKRDDAARGTLRELFSDRKVVQVPAQALAVGGGNIHCITQQQPRARP